MVSFRASLLLISGAIAFPAASLGCADPEGDYEAFNERAAKVGGLSQPAGDCETPLPAPGEPDGDFLMALSAKINPAKPIMFITRLTTAAMGDGALRTRVRHGIAEGGRYEIETEFDVARLLDLMFVFDLYFDGGGAPPWAARTLSDPLLDGRQRVDALMVRAQKFFNDIARGRQRPPQRAGS